MPNESVRVYTILFLVGFFGFIIAITSHATWQAPSESAQVLAGIVEYPINNPFFLYHIKLWTLLNQASALFLYIGISEATVSIVIVGFLGALSFSALSLIIHALSKNLVFSILGPMFMYYTNLVGHATGYPIWLMGTSHSYGIFGLSYGILVIGFFGVERYRMGSFLAGLAPAVHPSLGSFCLLIIGTAFIFSYRKIRKDITVIVKYFIFGAFLTIVSLFYQLQFFPILPKLDPDQKKQYLNSFIMNFDFHRKPIDWTSGGVIIAVMNLTICVAALLKKEATFPGNFVYKVIIASVVLAILLIPVSFLPQFGFVATFMPGRYFNIANISFLPIIVGILGARYYKNSTFNNIALCIFIFCSVLLRMLLPEISYKHVSRLLYISIGAFTFISLINFKVTLFSYKYNKFVSRVSAFFLLFAIAALVTPSIYKVFVNPEEILRSFVDRSNNDFYKKVSERKGILLTASNLHFIQLYTRRPVLIDGGGLDFFPYVPESGPELNNILRKVYGLDIFIIPPPEQKNKGVITDIHKPLWESRSVGEWREIKDEFNTTDILTYSDWNLKLPLVVETSGLKLYTIP